MKIEASTVKAHRFSNVRRKGYDPVEVDRVMERLVSTLQAYEKDTASLEARVKEADDSVDAIRRTFAAAQTTRQEMIDEGAARADKIVADAQREAETRLTDATTKIEAMYFDRDQVVIDAHERWAVQVADAEEESFQMLLEAENARAAAIGDRERVRELSDRAVEARLAEVTEEADSIANEIVGEARREELRISSRLDHLRAAITEVEIKIHDLAALATPYTEQIAVIIDLTAIEEDQSLAGSGRS
jgi:DivIVA domain-containing protein